MIDNLKKVLLQERKDNNKEVVGVMTIFISELENLERNKKGSIDNNDIVSLAKKYVSNNIECLNHTVSETVKDKLIKENKWLSTLIPAQMSNNELLDIAQGYTQLGDYMKYLNQNFPGMFDKQLAASLFKSK